MDKRRGNGHPKRKQHGLEGVPKTSSKSEGKESQNESAGIKRMDETLSDDDLEEIVGGLTTVVVPLCKNCRQRVAVHQMALCAACFLKLK